MVWPFSALFIRALYGDLTGRRWSRRRTARDCVQRPPRGTAARGSLTIYAAGAIGWFDRITSVGSYQRFSSASRRCTVDGYTSAGSVDRSWKLM